jgi:hypothetical protein
VILGPAGDSDVVLSPAIDLDRICVTARSVVDGLPGLMDDGLAGGGLQKATAHAATLADLPTLQALSLPDIRDHGRQLCDTLVQVGSEQALTHVVWFEDALGAA